MKRTPLKRKTGIKPRRSTLRRGEPAKAKKRVAAIPARVAAGLAVRITRDGREICQNNAAGRREYQRRRENRWYIDKGICCLCGTFVDPRQATTEHPEGRGLGGSHRNDRVSEIRVAHLAGNLAKGSIRLEMYLQLPLAVRMRNCGVGV